MFTKVIDGSEYGIEVIVNGGEKATTYEINWESPDGEATLSGGEANFYPAALSGAEAFWAEALDQCANDAQRQDLCAGTMTITAVV